MPSLLVLAIMLPLAGAVGLLVLSLFSRLRPYTFYVALGVVFLALILTLLIRWEGPVEVVPSLWFPSHLLGAAPMLQNEGALQPFVFVLVVILLAATLVALSRAEEPRPRLLAASLALLAAAFVSLWSANPLTMIVGWACCDLLLAVGGLAAGDPGRRATRVMVLGGLATLLLWMGTLLVGSGNRSALWGLMAPADAQLTLWMAAVLLRLWIYPFHLAIPDEPGGASAQMALGVGPVIGWGLCLRLALANGGALPGAGWVPLLAALTLALGSFLAWSCRSPRAALPWIGMAVNGALLLAAWLVGENAPAVIAVGGVVWVLGMSLLALSDGLRRAAPWWSIPGLIGALALIGLPLTLGFAPWAGLLRGIAIGVHLEWGAAFLLGNLFLIPSLTRWLLAPASGALPGRGWRLALLGLGLALPAALLLVAGFYPPLLIGGVTPIPLQAAFAMPGVVGWVGWGVALAGGGVLAWQDGSVRARVELLLGAAHDLLRLEWLYSAVVGALDRGLSVLRVIDEVVGGAGSLLWSLVLFLLILMLLGG